VAILLYRLGKDYRDVYNAFEYADGKNKDTLQDVLEKFDQHFEPHKMTKLYMRKFDTCIQKPDETFNQYLARLRQVASLCDFGTTLDNQLAKQLSLGVRSQAFKDKLWSENLSLANTIIKCQLYEQKEETKSFLGTSKPTADVNMNMFHQRKAIMTQAFILKPSNRENPEDFWETKRRK
jgi:hypothetical protein